MGSHLLFPGTFDPPTLGHLDLVRRALAFADRVTVAVAEHPTKEALLPKDERRELFAEALAGTPGADVVALDGLVVEGCRELGCDGILRGVRSGSDFEYEARMSATNRILLPGCETVLLAASPEVAHITSTLVRQITRMGGDITPFVPPIVARHLAERS
ncbi:MAG TPA: pantetheine-phosphate adenylyltransferase [Planctomycetes bacterium]|nr:pantetheine-phosphate adenylyltransferase [Planctomycetota bacterium]